MAERNKLPAWVNVGLIPAINLTLAFLISGIVVMAIGEDPVEAVTYLVYGSFGYGEAIGYTLFYATNFIFTGLGVAIAFHGRLLNIGAEGQAYVGGLGIALVCLGLGDMPLLIMLPLAMVGGAVLGGAWAFIPAYLQAKRGSHIVITTIMFNYIASAMMTWLLVGWLHRPGSQLPESNHFPESSWMPQFYDIAKGFGLDVGRSPVNVSIVIAILCCVAFWIYVWRTRWGYELRTLGQNEDAAVFAGMSPVRITIITMLLSGGLAGLMGMNELLGSQHRLLVNFTNGYGFVGIAVALMGRNHPVGIFLAALLMGALYQGGAEMAFEMPTITRDIVWVIQGLVILFTGALEHMFRPQLEALFIKSRKG